MIGQCLIIRGKHNIRQKFKIKIRIFFRKSLDTEILYNLKPGNGNQIFVKGDVNTDPELSSGTENVIVEFFVTIGI